MSRDPNLELMAKLFGFLSDEVVRRFGDEGEEAVLAAVRSFGESRGADIARRVRDAGAEPTVKNYLEYYDMQRDTGFEVRTELGEGRADQVFEHCPLWEVWREMGLEDAGYLYCREIDASLTRGYNPRMVFRHHSHFRDPEGRCRMSFCLPDEE